MLATIIIFLPYHFLADLHIFATDINALECDNRRLKMTYLLIRATSMSNLNTVLSDNNTDIALVTTLNTISTACQSICAQLHNGALAGILGSAEHTNVQGETQKKLDVISNNILKEKLLATVSVRALTSEEEDEFVDGNPDGQHIVHFDPLDGSSNIDINAPVGTIFSIYQAPSISHLTEADLLMPGTKQVAAGYVLYGPSAILVLTTGNGVNMFTLEPASSEFVLTDAGVKIEPATSEFAINMSNQRHWALPMQNYISDLLAGSSGCREKNFNMRWLAAMVGDVHRVLCRGGIFTYPWDQREPEKAGKLRLMYEANPMAFLVEQAGGLAWTDHQRIMDIMPTAIHQRVPVILGSADEVKACLNYHDVSP
ncbi:MAG: fructose-1,6-bisphosphatase I [Chitinophagales bacterium]